MTVKATAITKVHIVTIDGSFIDSVHYDVDDAFARRDAIEATSRFEGVVNIVTRKVR